MAGAQGTGIMSQVQYTPKMGVRGRARVARALATVVVMTLSLATAHAQTTVTPEDEYKKLIKVNEDIQPLGETPFGEQIGLYDGSLSFRQVDVTVPGTGPTITVARVFTLPAFGDRFDLQNRAFGEWDMELPQIDTVTANQNNVKGWVVDTDAQTSICTKFNDPPSVAPPAGDMKRSDWETPAWWQGYQLKVPGAGSQELLKRDTANTPTPGVAGLTYPIITKQDWVVGCLSQANNDPTTQAFLAVAPDGTKYWLDHLSYRYMPGISRPLGSSPAALTASRFHVLLATTDNLTRREGRMLATRVEDRFGNWIAYTYSGDLVTDITASDGRHVTLSYIAGTSRVGSITVQGGAAGQRTWTYGYTHSAQNLVDSLTGITQPDGSTWSFDMDGLNGAFVDMRGTPGTCDSLGTLPDSYPSFTGRMTHPSGMTGAFTVRPVRRGRSNVYRVCEAGPNLQTTNPAATGTWAYTPSASYSMAIQQEQRSGAGIGTQAWNYAYSPSNESWKQNCNGTCTGTVWTTVTYPDNHAERSTFSNRYDWTESQLITEEVFDGAADATNRRRLVQYSYVAPDPSSDARAGAYVRQLGYTLAPRVNTDQVNLLIPMGARVTSVDNDAFTWYATGFDAFARPTQVQRNSSAGYSVSEQTSYQDDYAHWVIGLPLQFDNLSTGETVSRNVYDANSLTLSERYRFGRKVMGYTFNAQGQLASFTDGNGHTTSVGNYLLGIPRQINYPDGTAQTVSVDGLGQITAISDQTGAITGYAYDGIGRLARIDYPAGDSVAWASKTLQYSFIGDARGIGGPHWVRVDTQGSWNHRIDFDVMMRPVALGTAEANSGAGYVSSRTDYDWAGRKVFQSYAVDGAPDLNGMGLGVVTHYDVLGRLVQQVQHTELGDLSTNTSYPQSIGRRVTDPKGNVTTSYFQAFDQPTYDNAVRVEAPENVLQTIQRDTYGNPLSITQGGLGQSVTKTMTYDSEHRLCRTWEPESGSEIRAYDGADNIAWSVSGASFNSTGCGQDQVADALKTLRGYDAMNRVTSVVYPAGTDPSTFTYDPRGNPATATAGMASWTFGRNRLGLLTSEVLSVDGWNWGLSYSYDNKGALSSIAYPDGNSVAYAPNGLMQPTQVGGYAAGVSYYPDGDLKSYSLGNGAIYTSDKNARNLLSNFTFGKGGVPNLSEDLAYDANGNVTQITDESGANQRSKSMSYDGLNRLVSATAGQLWGTESYTYDTLNNIRTLTNSSGTNTYNYDGSNLLVSISNAGAPLHAFQYDARGNTSGKDGQALTFDLANRLTSIPGKGAYTYDAAGRRVKKVAPQGTTYYAYNAAGQLMWEYDAASTNGTSYIYLGKKLLASKKGVTSKVIGNIDGISSDNNSVNGWACSTGLPQSIDVHLYVGGPAGTGTFLRAVTANVASEAAVQQACHGSGSAYRFSISLAEADKVTYYGQALFIHGISPVGGSNDLIQGSGQSVMPRSANAPPAPSPATATSNADKSAITVAWTAAARATRYEVWQVHNGAWTSLYTGTALSAVASTPADGPYLYEARACNDSGCSIYAETGLLNLAHIPPTVASISAPSTSTGSAAVSWSAAAYATSYQVDHYDNQWSLVYNGPATSATFTEGHSGTWLYRVRACNPNGCGGYAASGGTTVLLPPTPAPTLSGGGTTNSGAYGLSWSASTDAASYNLVESANGGGWTGLQNTTSQNWSIGDRPDGTYSYMVQACNASACTSWSNQVTVTVAHIPVVPTVIGMNHAQKGKLETYTLQWAAEAYATRYEIIRYPAGVTVYSSNGTSFQVESGFEPYDLKYTYAIRACNAVGCSAYSRTL
jgi:YD repeat-containing protein